MTVELGRQVGWQRAVSRSTTSLHRTDKPEGMNTSDESHPSYPCGVFLATKFQASFARAVQSPQICGLLQLAEVLIAWHVLIPTVLRSLPCLRVD